MELLDDLLLVSLALQVEPFVEVLRGAEDVRKKEVEQRPQLVQVVLSQ